MHSVFGPRQTLCALLPRPSYMPWLEPGSQLYIYPAKSLYFRIISLLPLLCSYHAYSHLQSLTYDCSTGLGTCRVQVWLHVHGAVARAAEKSRGQ